MSAPNLFRRSAVGVTAVAVVAAGLVLSGGDNDANQITTTIADAGQLEKGAEVRSAGVRIGQVSDIVLVGDKARLTIDVNDGVLPLHDDATLTMRPVNVLGENYIDLDAGSDKAAFADSTVIPEERTSVAVTLQDVLNTFEDPTAAGLASLVTTLGEGLDDNGAELAKALKVLAPAMQDTGKVGAILSEQNEVLASLVKATDPVTAALAADGGKTLDSLVESTRDTLAALGDQQVALEATLRELPGTLLAAQRTLGRFGATARAGTPTLKALRPLTGDLEDVVEELRNFADSADPALASLKPVLDEADRLLDAAAPVVATLRQAGPDLASTAASLKPLSRALLDNHLQDVMDFVRKWALSTNGRDGLSHYFRGVVYVTPSTLSQLAQSLVPVGALPKGSAPAAKGNKAPNVLPGLPDLGKTVDGLLDGLGGSLLGLLGKQPPKASASSATDPTSALGLTALQEQNLLGQLLGGNK
ncbi:MlaD family protein [Nocardioides sp. GCM10030258]|uniref:MlaD family protein n=1 Tax=unclassified Nocardioides TaxID=2615069 RepID=UPI0036239D86